MLFDVHVIPQLAFPDWVASTAGSGQILNEESYKKLTQQTIERNKPTYRLDDPTLFQAIVSQRLPPGPGPQITSESAQSYIRGSDVR
jgi:cytochrome o ubiquinol oxidase subunit 2